MTMNNFPIPAYFVVIFFISCLKSSIAKSKPWINLLPTNLLSDFHLWANKLHFDSEALDLASSDYGNLIKETPAAVLFPSSVNDIVSFLTFANNMPVPINVAARGRGHCVRGQAMARNGVVVDMTALNNHGGGCGRITVSEDASTGFYADVGGEQLWIDVLKTTLEYGLAPKSWTDYLYITVGGTLSNAGIGGQTFRYGPQINNVIELDVITGKGDLVSCSEESNSELFHAALGGFGQFGIIVRARIPLHPAPKRVKWVRMLYSDFSKFSKDQERLISMNGREEKNALDYLEGLLLMHDGPPDNWRSSFFPPSDHSRIISLVNHHSIIYCLEIAKFYDDFSQNTIHKELEDLLEGLDFMPGFMFEKDVTYIEFLNRVRSGELKLQEQGLWDVPHPWLNLFVPKSRISDFDSGVFKDIVLKRNITKGLVLVYPMNKIKWDDRMSAVIPDEDVFYTIGFLHSSGFEDWKAIDDQNKEILKFCNNAGINIKQYLPHYKTQADWKQHFGPKWRKIEEMKNEFDPKMILSPGQKIFNV